MCVYVPSRCARAFVLDRHTQRDREREMKSSRQRITDPGHVSGVAAAGSLLYMRSARTASTIACGLTFFGRIILYIYIYSFIYFILYIRATTDAVRACVYTTVMRWILWYAATVSDPRHPPTGFFVFCFFFCRLSYNIVLYYRCRIIHYTRIFCFFFYVSSRNRNETAAYIIKRTSHVLSPSYKCI